jgi:O-acetylhomoserine (thiol)-lyase
MKGFTTKALHGVREPDLHRALRPPVYESVTFEFDSSADLENAFLGRKPAHVYSRITNPTVAEFEKRLTYLSGAIGTIAVSSGMASIANTILSIAGAGDNIVISPFLFGNTFSLFSSTLKRWGLEIRLADFSDMNAIEKLLDDRTRAVYLESITNPQLAVYDIPQIARIAEKRGVLVVLDNTVLTPYIFNSKSAGVHVEVLSATKYISGGGTAVGGAIIDNGTYDWSKNPHLRDDVKAYGQFCFLRRLRQDVYRNTGTCMSPHTAYLLSLGLETLALRVERSFGNALHIAEYLLERNDTNTVNYPGLRFSGSHQLAESLFGGKYGGILTFSLKNKEDCYRFMDALKIIRRATNINDNKTLIIHPASTIYCEFSPEERKKLGVPDNLLRLSAGIEDTGDLIEDIEQALKVPD